MTCVKPQRKAACNVPNRRNHAAFLHFAHALPQTNRN
jgi:hypothetical protein